MHFADGRMSAVEVMSSADKTLDETHDAIVSRKRGGSTVATRNCENTPVRT